jgi:hypothetical protein
MITIYIKDDGTVDWSDDRNEGLYAEATDLEGGLELSHAGVIIHVWKAGTKPQFWFCHER